MRRGGREKGEGFGVVVGICPTGVFHRGRELVSRPDPSRTIDEESGCGGGIDTRRGRDVGDDVGVVVVVRSDLAVVSRRGKVGSMLSVLLGLSRRGRLCVGMTVWGVSNT